MGIFFYGISGNHRLFFKPELLASHQTLLSLFADNELLQKGILHLYDTRNYSILLSAFPYQIFLLYPPL
jgi:hypothetical protein